MCTTVVTYTHTHIRHIEQQKKSHLCNTKCKYFNAIKNLCPYVNLFFPLHLYVNIRNRFSEEIQNTHTHIHTLVNIKQM